MSEDPILITGVGRRVGLFLAHAFLDRGQPLIGTFRTTRNSIDALRARGAELYHCDFHDPGQVAALIDAIVQRHARLRAIIHNASEWLPDDCGERPEDIMQRVMDVHVSVPYRLNLALAPLLKAGTPSDIIHIGDYVSSRGSTRHIAYAASKAAQDNLTLSFATLLSPEVKVNSIAPALVVFNEDDDEVYRRKALRKSLMQRAGGLDEMLHQVDYLLDSSYVTGRIISMDGGRHLAMAS